MSLFFGGNRARTVASDFVDREEDMDRREMLERTRVYPTRAVQTEKSEMELANHIRKATSADETAPKQKHVRKCIVYTWDYHSSSSFWTGLKTLPLQGDEVMTFKALITIHKVLQDGHPCVLKDAQKQGGLIESLGRAGSIHGRGYGPLIGEYAKLILSKISFHKVHPAFTGTFEYEEYVSLRGIEDPNEGYETITDLMGLMRRIDTFQKQVFSRLNAAGGNECKISVFVPLVKESYGIYKFITSMLRSMYKRTDAVDALEPLKERYGALHRELRKFYYNCSGLRYLTGLINVPKLPAQPPSLLVDDEDGPMLPERPDSGRDRSTTVTSNGSSSPTLNGVDLDAQRAALAQYEADQQRLQREREAEQQRAAAERERAQREFQEMERAQRERERLAQEQLQQQLAAQQQMHMGAQWQQRAAELEQQALAMQGQYERDQMMLEQYDMRVRALENESGVLAANAQAQMQGKDDLIASLQQQLAALQKKYDDLAKLYTLLRNEHLDHLTKSKALQLRANTAHETLAKMENLQNEMHAKSAEHGDMVRQRDRARFDLDRLKAEMNEKVERAQRDARLAEDRARANTDSRNAAQLEILQKDLAASQKLADDLQVQLQIKEEEVEETLRHIAHSSSNKDTEDALNAQIDELVLDQDKKVRDIIDSTLQLCEIHVDDAVYDLSSGDVSSSNSKTPQFALSITEKAIAATTEFSMTFSPFLSRSPRTDYVRLIQSAHSLASTVADALKATKAVAGDAVDSDDTLLRPARLVGEAISAFFRAMPSFKMISVPAPERQNILLLHTSDARESLQRLITSLDSHSQQAQSGKVAHAADAGSLVDSELAAAARAVADAAARLEQVRARPVNHNVLDTISHGQILDSATTIMAAISHLIQASINSQTEIVAHGKGTGSPSAFYKKNHRWTEGLISAAKAVARAASFLIETADGVFAGYKSLEQLIVASNEVAGSTAQLVQAARVKSDLMSHTQAALEDAAKAVTAACRALVRRVKQIIPSSATEEAVDYDSLASREFKTLEMETRVEILKHEKALADLQRKLGHMRRSAYHADDDEF